MIQLIEEIEGMVRVMHELATSDGASPALRKKAAKLYGDLSSMLSIAMREQAKAMSASLKTPSSAG